MAYNLEVDVIWALLSATIGQLNFVVSCPLHVKIFLFVNDGIVINSCDPQILWCVVCNYVLVDDDFRLFAHGESKGCEIQQISWYEMFEKTCF